MKKKIVIISAIFICLVLTGFTVNKELVKKHKGINNYNPINQTSKILKVDSKDIVVKAEAKEDRWFKSWDTGELYDHIDTVVIGKVLSREDGRVNQAGNPITLGTIQIEKIIKGKVDKDIITFSMNGGICTVEEFVKNQPEPIRAEKLGFTKMSPEEQKIKYFKYDVPFQKNFEVGKEYVLMLKTFENDPNYYVISKAGFLDLDIDTENKFKNISSKIKITAEDINSKEDIMNMPNACFE